MASCRNCKGFSLIELMIGVAVVAILTAIAVPSYLGIQKKAARSKAKANLEALSITLEGYMAENNDYGPAGRYIYICGGNCESTSFAPAFPSTANSYPLGTLAKIGGGLDYDYAINVTTQPGFVISALPVRGRVVGDLTPWVRFDGAKGPPNFGW